MPQRHCWVITGPVDKSRAVLAKKLTGVAPERILQGVDVHTIHQHLGRESDYLIVDAHAGFNPDVVAAALGTLRGGGLCCVLLPSWAHWPEQVAGLQRLAPYPFPATAVGRRFITRIRAKMAAEPWVRVIHWDALEHHRLPTIPVPTPYQLTTEQQAVVAAVQRVALGHARRPLVISADRGRGKSTALGAALAALLVTHPTKCIVVIAPSKAAVHSLLAQLPEPGLVRVYLPETYQQASVPCDLMVVDEAAAIPLPMLAEWLVQQNRIVYSSTAQGYEGSGRGFLLRFTELLQRETPQWRAMTLEQPVRWSAGDRLEALFNRSLLLAVTEAAQPKELKDNSAAWRLNWITQTDLAADEHTLCALVALLVSAHYQTRPSDLQQLLDAPGLQILLAWQGQRVVGVLLAIAEGGLDDTLSRAISAGKRRPQGHLLVQSLACHAGLVTAPRLRIWRVQRIAVVADQRHRGIGQAMLRETIDKARIMGLEGVGVAFALDAVLLSFWQQAGFRVLRIGQRRDPASGARSVLMINAWSQAGAAMMQQGHIRLQRDIPWLLGQTLTDLMADVVAGLMLGRDCTDIALDAKDHADVTAACVGRRHIADVRPALWRWYSHQLAQGTQCVLSEKDQQLLLGLLMQNQSSVDLQKRLNIKGKKKVDSAVRAALQQLVTGCEINSGYLP